MQSDNCKNCKWYAGVGVCKAFPDGIPEKILTGEIVHTKPLPGQINDFVLTPIEDELAVDHLFKT